MTYDPVNHPKHYVEQSAKVEPIDILRFAPFDLGNALKYLIRAGHKDDELQDLLKADWYLKCAISSVGLNYEPYEHFFNHFLPILIRFKLFDGEDFGYSVPTLISKLRNDVRERIEELKNEHK